MVYPIGNPAGSVSSVALRPRLAAGLRLSILARLRQLGYSSNRPNRL